MGLSVRNLSKSFGETVVLHDVSFDVADGEFVSLLGPSGCGKTTTLRCIAGLEEPDAGTIRIAERLVADPAGGVMIPPHERDVGMVFQSYAIWPHMTVYENVAFPLRIQKQSRAAIAEKVARVLDLVGMRAYERRRATELSGGQQQRIALARAIVQEPKVLLFDEPLSNLDVKLRERMRAELRALQQSLRITAVYVTHDQSEALSLSDRVVVMEGGRLVQVGTPNDLYDRPVSEFVADFVGTANFIDVRVEARDGVTSAVVADGSTFEIPAGFSASGRCRVMIRPEDLEIVPAAGAPGDDPGWNRFRGQVRQQLYLGAHYDYTVDVAGTALRVLSRSKIVEPEVLLRFRSEDCTVLAAPPA